MQRGHWARDKMVLVGPGLTQSSQEQSLLQDWGILARVGAVRQSPWTQAGQEVTSLCLPVLTSLAGQVAGWGPPWAMVERAATKLAVGFPPKETSIRVSVLRLQVVVVGAHIWAGKAIVRIFQTQSILIPMSFSELSTSLTVFTGPVTQESKISWKQ